MPWRDITTTEQYQSLPPEQQIEQKRAYFRERVLPSIRTEPRLNVLTDDVLERVWLERPDDSGQDYFTSLLSSAGRGAASIVPGAVGGLGYLTGSETLKQAGEDIESGIEEFLPVNPAYEQDFAMKAAGAVGQAVGFFGTGGVGGLAGKALGGARAAGKLLSAAEEASVLAKAASNVGRALSAAEKSQVLKGAAVAKATKLGAETVGLGSGILGGVREGGQTAEQYGLEGTAGYLSALGRGAIEGASEKLLFGLGTETAAVRKLLGDTLEKGAGGFAKDTLTEGAEEVFAQGAGNLLTSGLLGATGSEIEGPGLTEGMGEAFALGAVGGATFGTINALTGAYRPNALPDEIDAEQVGNDAFPEAQELINQAVPTIAETASPVAAAAVLAEVNAAAEVGLSDLGTQEGDLLEDFGIAKVAPTVESGIGETFTYPDDAAQMEQQVASAEDQGILADVIAEERQRAMEREFPTVPPAPAPSGAQFPTAEAPSQPTTADIARKAAEVARGERPPEVSEAAKKVIPQQEPPAPISLTPPEAEAKGEGMTSEKAPTYTIPADLQEQAILDARRLGTMREGLPRAKAMREFMDKYGVPTPVANEEQLQPYLQPQTPQPDAVQEPSPTEGVLRQEGPELELPRVAEQDTEEAAQGASAEAEVAARTLTDVADELASLPNSAPASRVVELAQELADRHTDPVLAEQDAVGVQDVLDSVYGKKSARAKELQKKLPPIIDRLRNLKPSPAPQAEPTTQTATLGEPTSRDVGVAPEQPDAPTTQAPTPEPAVPAEQAPEAAETAVADTYEGDATAVLGQKEAQRQYDAGKKWAADNLLQDAPKEYSQKFFEDKASLIAKKRPKRTQYSSSKKTHRDAAFWDGASRALSNWVKESSLESKRGRIREGKSVYTDDLDAEGRATLTPELEAAGYTFDTDKGLWKKTEAAETAVTPSVLKAAETADSFSPSDAATQVYEAVKDKNPLELADWLIRNAPNEALRVIAARVREKLSQRIAAGADITIKWHTGDERPNHMSAAKGRYVSKRRFAGEQASIVVHFNGPAVVEGQLGWPSGANYTTLLHELVHAALPESALGPEFRDLFNTVVKKFNESTRESAIEQRIFKREVNALEKPEELLAWGLTDSAFQEFLASIEVPREGTAWSKFVSLIRDALGLSKKYNSALDELLRLSDGLFSESMGSTAKRVEGANEAYGFDRERAAKNVAPPGVSSDQEAHPSWALSTQGDTVYSDADGLALVKAKSLRGDDVFIARKRLPSGDVVQYRRDVDSIKADEDLSDAELAALRSVKAQVVAGAPQAPQYTEAELRRKVEEARVARLDKDTALDELDEYLRAGNAPEAQNAALAFLRRLKSQNPKAYGGLAVAVDLPSSASVTDLFDAHMDAFTTRSTDPVTADPQPKAKNVRPKPKSRNRYAAYGSILRTKVSTEDAQRAVELETDTPGLDGTMFGTLAELRDQASNNPGLLSALDTAEREDAEAFFWPDKDGNPVAVVIVDQMAVYSLDAALARQNGTTPAVEAVRRVLRHENVGHRGWGGLPQHLRDQWLAAADELMSPEDADDLVSKGYREFADWRTNDASKAGLFEEWVARQTENPVIFANALKRANKGTLRDLLRDLWNWLTGGNAELLDPSDEQLVQLVADLLTYAGRAPAGRVMKASYAGRRAIENLPEERRQFMRDSLATAEAMAAAGKSSEEIRAVTGWFPGKYDGKMRWEIPDEGATANPPGIERLRKGEEVPLQDVLRHQKLFAAYPSLRDVGVLMSSNNAYNERSDTILLRRGSGLGTLLHEIQHAIQRRESWPRGGTPSVGAWLNPEMREALLKVSQDTFKKMQIPAPYDTWLGGAEGTPELRKEYDNYVKDLKTPARLDRMWVMAQEGAASNLYPRLAGEIEARDVQARLSYTPEQRKAVAPYSSENIAPEDAIVLFGSRVAESRRALGTSLRDLMPQETVPQTSIPDAYARAREGSSTAFISLGDILDQMSPGYPMAQFEQDIQQMVSDGSAILEPVNEVVEGMVTVRDPNTGQPGGWLYVPEQMRMSRRMPEAIPSNEGGDLPPSTWATLEKEGYSPEASEKTQITTTAATYEKIVRANAKEGMVVLDYAAGRGAGTKAAKDIGAREGFTVVGFEPFSNKSTRVIKPEFEGVGASSEIPAGSVDLVINNAVLNVVPESTGREIVRDIYSKLKPGGSAFINVMGWSNIKSRLNNPKTRLVGPREVITVKGTFQKGYTFDTLRELISGVVPEAVIERTSYGDVGLKVTKPETPDIRFSRRMPDDRVGPLTAADEADDKAAARAALPKEITVVAIEDEDDLDEEGNPMPYYIIGLGSPEEVEQWVRDDAPRDLWAIGESDEQFTQAQVHDTLYEGTLTNLLPRKEITPIPVRQHTVRITRGMKMSRRMPDEAEDTAIPKTELPQGTTIPEALKPDKVVTDFWSVLSEDPTAFKFRTTDSADPKEVARVFSTPESPITAETQQLGALELTTFTTPSGGRIVVNLLGPKAITNIDDSGSVSGQLYQAALTLVHNSGRKKVQLDLTPKNKGVRLISNMLSSALRHGTTKHLSGDLLPIEWEDGNDSANIAAMAQYEAAYVRENLAGLPPASEILAAAQRGGVDRAGATPQAGAGDWFGEVAGDTARAANLGVGPATLVRTALTESALEGVDPRSDQVRGAVGQVTPLYSRPDRSQRPTFLPEDIADKLSERAARYHEADPVTGKSRRKPKTPWASNLPIDPATGFPSRIEMERTKVDTIMNVAIDIVKDLGPPGENWWNFINNPIERRAIGITDDMMYPIYTEMENQLDPTDRSLDPLRFELERFQDTGPGGSSPAGTQLAIVKHIQTHPRYARLFAEKGMRSVKDNQIQGIVGRHINVPSAVQRVREADDAAQGEATDNVADEVALEWQLLEAGIDLQDPALREEILALNNDLIDRAYIEELLGDKNLKASLSGRTADQFAARRAALAKMDRKTLEAMKSQLDESIAKRMGNISKMRTKAAPTRKGSKAKTVQEQAEDLLDRASKQQAKRKPAPNPVRDAYRDQLKRPTSREEFVKTLAGIGVDADTAGNLYDAAAAKRVALEMAAAKNSADAILNRLAVTHSDTQAWRKKAAANPVTELYNEHLKSKLPKPDFVGRMEKLGVDRTTAENIWSMGNTEREARRKVKDAKRPNKADEEKLNTAQKTARDILNRLAVSQSDTQAWPKKSAPNPMRDLYNRHMKTPVSLEEFVKEATDLGVAESEATNLWNVANRERRNRETVNKLTREDARRRSLLDLTPKTAPDRAASKPSTIRGLLSKAKSELLGRMNWDTLFNHPLGTQREWRQELFNKVRADEAFANLTDQEARDLAAELDRLWNEQRQKAVERDLKKLTPSGNEEVRNRVAKATPALLRAINRGTFNESTFRTAIAPKFGIGVLSDAEMQKVSELAAKAQDMSLTRPERKQAGIDMVELLQKNTDLTKAEVLSNWWVTSVLSGPRTLFDMAFNFLNGARIVSQFAVAAAATKKGGVKSAFRGFQDYMKGLYDGIQEAIAYIISGDDALLDSTERRLNAYFGEGSRAVPVDAWGKVMRDPKSNVLNSPAAYFFGTIQRMMIAFDHVTAVSTSEGLKSLAITLNPSIYGDAQLPDADDIAAAKETAKRVVAARLPEGANLDSFVNKRQVNAATRQILNDVYAKRFPRLLDDVQDIGMVASFQNDPTGLGGFIYHGLLNMNNRLASSAGKFKEKGAERRQSAQEKYYRDMEAKGVKNPPPYRASAEQWLREAVGTFMFFEAVNSRNQTGLRFVRFVGNKLNEMLSFLPGMGYLRWFEDVMDENPLQKQLLHTNQIVGGMTSAALAVALWKLAFDSDDEDEESPRFMINGPWNYVKNWEQKNRLRDVGSSPNSIEIRDEDGNLTVFNYTNWPLSGLLAAVGNLIDMKRFDRETWESYDTYKLLGAGLMSTGGAVFDMNALSAFTSIFLNRDTFGRDPVGGLGDRLAKWAANYAGGFIPRMAKDIDLWQEPTYNRPEDLKDLFWKEVPFFRRTKVEGEKALNMFGEPVRVERAPWSRAVVRREVEEHHKVARQLIDKGIFFSAPNPDVRTVQVPMSNERRPMDDNEAEVYVTEAGRLYKNFFTSEGERVLAMPRDVAKKYIDERLRVMRNQAFIKATMR